MEPHLSPQQTWKTGRCLGTDWELGAAAVVGRVGKLSSEVAVVRVCPTVCRIWESFTIPTACYVVLSRCAYIIISAKSSNRYTQRQFTNVLSCEMQSKFRDFKKRLLRCSNIAQLAFQSLHTFFASLRSYLNLGAACTTVGKQHTLIHYLQPSMTHVHLEKHLCKKGPQSNPRFHFDFLPYISALFMLLSW